MKKSELNETEKMKPEVSIIIVNYNGLDDLEACLISIRKHARSPAYEVLVVDNASSDGSPEMVERSHPWVRLIRSSKNLGFSRANNLGLKQSRGGFIWFLNPDTILHADSLEILYSALTADSGTGAAGPALLTRDNRYQFSFGGRVRAWNELVRKLWLDRFGSRIVRRSRENRRVVWLSGASLFCRRKAVEEAGGFDEGFFLYFEDIDLCYRMKKMGWEIVFVPEASLIHSGGNLTSKSPLASRYQYRRSQIYFYRKHNQVWDRAFLMLFLAPSFFLGMIKARLFCPGEWKTRKNFFRLLKKVSPPFLE